MDASNLGCLVYTLGGPFSDSGLEAGRYWNFEDNTMTLSSSNGETIKLDFAKFHLETEKDFLYVFGPMNSRAKAAPGSLLYRR